MEELRLLKVFAGRTSAYLAKRVCQHISQELSKANGKPVSFEMGQCLVESFPDGEVFVKLHEDVRGRDCYVVLSTCQPVNDNLMELLVFVDCLRRASAKRITAVLPYFGYARQDRKDEGRVPITAKLVANLMTAAKIDRVLTIDLHAAQIQGFFDLPVDHLSATPVFFDHFANRREELDELCLVSPDVGNVKVAEGFANLLGGDLAIINKRRVSGSEVTTGHLIGNVRGKTVLMFDDMISTGGTVAKAAKLVMDEGAKKVIAAATHGVFAGAKAAENLSTPAISEIIVTNTVPLTDRINPIRHKVTELCVGDLLGEAIHRIHSNLSISALFHKTAGTKR
jgi:ribose-phosphate pyrophosphokinase